MAISKACSISFVVALIFGAALSRYSKAACSLISYAVYAKRRRRNGSSDDHASVPRPLPSVVPPMDAETLEQNNRTIAFFGDGFENIRNSFVVIVGLGGVGSHSAIMLLRSGVERLRFIDFDVVTQSSLNRHACATRHDLGRPKAYVLAQYAKQVCPNADVDGLNTMLTSENIELLLANPKPNYVVDNIDNRETKVLLIEYCLKNKIPIISSMGAGGQADPTRVRIGDISEAKGPLAKEMRRRLRKAGIVTGLKVVYPTEVPRARLISKGPQQSPTDNPQRFRSGVMPVVGFMPAIFGNACVSVVLTDLVGKPLEPEVPHSNREHLYLRCLRRLEEKGLIRKGGYARATGQATEKHTETDEEQQPLPDVDIQDVEYMIEELWRGQCAFTGNCHPLTLTRWDPAMPFSRKNCILLVTSEAKKHESVQQDLTKYPSNIFHAIEERLKIATID
mmetsp:Transcript_36184/g.58469  ORF Transcript_36184/g.58469 Transcript_36184/m.58469 type:complete len:450 (-) Transcript_36184:1053-2402(-)